MSAIKLQHSKNRIAPPFLKKIMVLILFLSSIVIFPVSSGIALSIQSIGALNGNQPTLYVQEELNLVQEKFDVIAGKNGSVISSLELDGGSIQTPFDLSVSELSSISKIELIVSNQSSFSKIWTNPLWQYPDGLVIRMTIKSQNYDRIKQTYLFIDNVIRRFYNVSLSIFNLQPISFTETVISMVAPISFVKALQLFDLIFAPYNQGDNGNAVSIIKDILVQSPVVYAFGYSLHKQLGSVIRIIRSAIVGEENKIQNMGGQRTFNLNTALGASLEPNSHATVSRFTFNLPFIANITSIDPSPDNVGGKITGSIEWVLKYFFITPYPVFNPEIIYYPFTFEDFTFPRVIVSNSYSDQLLEDDGILNMTYTITNTGTETAYDTRIVFPVPAELDVFIQDGFVIPVLKEELQILENFTSHISLKISYGPFIYNVPIADVRGWYENTANLTLERWVDTNVIDLNGYISIHSTQGISSDLLVLIEDIVLPFLETIEISELVTNFAFYESLIFIELETAANQAYSVLLDSFYENKTLFNFELLDFANRTSIFGSYLECIIPQIEVNETIEKSWILSDIPTSSDRFGAFSFHTEMDDYIQQPVFQTIESDWKNLMLTLFSLLNSAGRFLSVYDSASDVFVSIGSRYQYYDTTRREYYGLTNGLNLQLGDDEAVLVSKLDMNKTIYRVGETVPFNLNIENLGEINAYDIHVDVVNLKLNYLWLPTDVVVVKTFDIDQISSGEEIDVNFAIQANSYIGLNSYAAILSFTSDKEQTSSEIVNPWTGNSIAWVHGGETSNVLTSTLTFGILFPPLSLENEIRPSFPLPEISVFSEYNINEENRSMIIDYEIVNEGLSESEIKIYQIFPKGEADIGSINCSLVHDGINVPQIPVVTSRNDYYVISYANVTLQPEDSITIKIQLDNLSEEFHIPPVVVSYYSIYEIYTTDFQSEHAQTDISTVNTLQLNIKQSSSNVTEGEQNLFIWSSFSSVIKINLPFSSEYDYILFSSLPWVYPLVSTAFVGSLIVIAMIISRIRR